MVFDTQAKKVSEALRALQEELAKDPKLATLDKVRKLLKDSQSQLDGIQTQIERANRDLAERVSESERRAREILQDAQNEAAQLVREAERVRDAAVALQREVEGREKAVEYIKTEEKKVEDARKAALVLNREASARLSDASAMKDLYVEKVKALRAEEGDLARREAVIAQKEVELKIKVEKPVAKKA